MNAITPDELKKGFIDAMMSPSAGLTDWAKADKGFGGAGENVAGAILRAAGVANGDDIAKAISTATGLIAYDLQAPAKNLYPTATPLRNMIPRVAGGVGTATNWRQVSAITGSGFDNIGSVPEGQRAGQMSYTTATKSASYATLGEEDQVTFEAIGAARTFEDIQATMAMRLLQKTMLKEEVTILAGNSSLQLGTPATPSLATATAAGATINITCSVIVVALTLQGFYNSSVAGGIATSKTVTGADGKTFVVNGGSSNKSAAGSQAVSTGNNLTATVTAVNGATAYAWFVGVAGSETLQAITTINSLLLTSLITGVQNASAVTADCSTNSTDYNGLLTTALTAGSGAYVKALATGTAGTGTALTPSGRGTVNEIDTMLRAMWDANQVSPSVLFMNSQEINNVTNKVLENSSAGPLLQYRQDPEGGGYQLDAGGRLATYYNPFLLDGGLRIPVRIHPKLPPGTIIGWANNLPAQYQSSEVPNVAEIKMRQDYYALDWPPVTRARQRGVYVEEVLAVYAPFAMGVITNIANG
jgi:hypothetical protein